MEEEKRYHHLYAILISFLPAMGVSDYLNQEYLWEIPEALLFVGILLLLGVIHACYHMRKQPVLYIVWAGIGAMTVFIVLWNQNYLSAHPSTVMILFQLLGVFVAAIISYTASKIYLLRVMIALAVFVTALFAGSTEIMFHKVGMAAVFVYCIMVLAEAALRKSFGKQKTKRQAAVEALLPVYLIAFLLLMAVPRSETCFQWKFMRSTISQICQSFTSAYDFLKDRGEKEYGEFSVKMTGYSEDGGIGGNIAESEEEALTLSGLSSRDRSIYLVGNCKNTYKDNTWTDTIEESEYPLSIPESSMDTMELLYSLYRYNGMANIKQYIQQNSLEICYEDIRTKSIFQVEKMKNIVFDSSERQRTDAKFHTSFDGLAGSGTVYNLEYYDLNIRSEKFKELVKKEQDYIYDESHNQDLVAFGAVVHRQEMFNGIVVPEELERDLMKRRTFIYDHYTQIDPKLAERIVPLTKKLTDNLSGTYEKLRAIESYLNTFEYTTNPEEPRDGEDIVSEFLFRTRAGYCTYFASAMALMGRSIGIPTRYVQGYVVPEDPDGFAACQVKQKQAHAWVEAYIDGVGWISFEPTAGYKRSDAWYGEGKKKTEATMTPVITAAPSVHVQKQEKTEEEKSISAITNWILFAGAGVLFLFLLAAIAIRICISRNKRRYKASDMTGQFYFEIMRMLWLLRKLSFERMPSETWNKYMERIREGIGKELPLLINIRESYSRVRYHGDEVQQNQLEEIIVQNNQLLALIKNRVRRPKYLVIRIKLAMLSARNMETRNRTD